jgi:hypothetical protein
VVSHVVKHKAQEGDALLESGRFSYCRARPVFPRLCVFLAWHRAGLIPQSVAAPVPGSYSIAAVLQYTCTSCQRCRSFCVHRRPRLVNAQAGAGPIRTMCVQLKAFAGDVEYTVYTFTGVHAHSRSTRQPQQPTVALVARFRRGTRKKRQKEALLVAPPPLGPPRRTLPLPAP